MNQYYRITLIISMYAFLTIILMNLSNRSYGVEQQELEIPQAKSVYDTETMHLPRSVGYFIILVANEAHEDWSNEKHKLLTDHNPYFVPSHILIPKGTAIVFLNADAPWNTPHPHTINIKDSSGKVIHTTGKMEYEWMKGTITVSDKTSTGKEIVGGFYSPTNQVSNNLDNDGNTHPGWLGYYESEFPKNGFNIFSKHNFSYNTCSYCEGNFWPDNKTGDHTLIIFGTDQSLSEAIVKLQKLVKDNVYI